MRCMVKAQLLLSQIDEAPNARALLKFEDSEIFNIMTVT